MRSRSFTVKIFLCFCAVILFSVLVPCGYFLHSIRLESIDFMRAEAFREAAFIRSALSADAAVAFREAASIRSALGTDAPKDALREKNSVPFRIMEFYQGTEHRVTLINREGKVLYDTHFSRVTDLPNHRSHLEVDEAFHSGRGSSVRQSQTLHEPFVYAALRTDIPDSEVYIIRVAAPLSLVESYASDRKRALFAGAFTALLFALGFAAFMSVSFHRSLHLMITAVENLAMPGVRSGRISLRSLPGDEFAPLASAVNSMAQRMEAQVGHILSQKTQIDAVLNSLAEGVLVIDHDGYVRRVNRALIRLFPRTSHAEGLQPIDVIPSAELQKGMEGLIGGTGKDTVQFEMDTDSGRKLQVQIRAIEGGDQMDMAVVAVFHDITEMAVLMDMRRDFVANVSHELRTPLTAIMGYAESLKRFVDEPRGQRFLEVIDRNSQYMATMVRDLLQLSSIESGAIPMNIRPVPASVVIHCGMELCRRAAEAKKLEFREDLQGEDFSIAADVEYLRRVMRNLLENACRYAPEGSSIVVSAKAEPDSGVAVFRVADSGPGIPSELRVRVFERFFRVEKHRGGQISTGLGLAICKHIIERHGGRIFVEDGKGCIMCFTIPLV
ncbi:sensor histidine kinase [Mailhella sp.]|uniref:sensor histidine kinase n=1 Tax=Mailhella sp. TaxID=1981029 RepID=UPI0040645D1A